MFFFGLISLVVVSAFVFLVPNVVWFVVWLLSRSCGFQVSYAPFAWSGLALVFVLWCLVFYGCYAGRFKLDVNRVEYHNTSLPPAFNGYRIVHISDLHLDSFGTHTEALEKVVDSINNLKPDLVCFTGDIVNLNPDAIKPYIPIISGIRAKDGVVSVLGNHDFFIYSREFVTEAQKDSATDEIARIEESMGWRLLRNENIVIRKGGDSLTIIGVDNIHCGNKGFKTIQKGDLSKAMDGADGFSILLTHDPTHWRYQVVPESDIPLTLSGHTHAAQMRFFGWTPASLMFPDAQGFSDEGGQTLYVNIGIGCTLPYRIWANPEVTEITLRR